MKLPLHLTVFAVIAFSIVAAGCLSNQLAANPPAAATIPLPRACFENGACVSLEIADTPQEREVGLMNRSSLPERYGMLFVFEQLDKHAFWMKNTLVPLDIAWISEQGKIVDVQSMIPCKKEECEIYSPKSEAKYALEMESGTAAANNLSVGQRISLKLEN